VSLERRLTRLEQNSRGGCCPVCAPPEVRLGWIFDIDKERKLGTPDCCPSCGRDVRIEIFEIDRILHGEGEGGGA
jgi:hypothetical protein